MHNTSVAIPVLGKMESVTPSGFQQGPWVVDWETFDDLELGGFSGSLCEAGSDSLGSHSNLKAVRLAPEDKKLHQWEAIVQSWEGRVVYNDPEAKEFVAVIRDLTVADNPDEEVAIGYESVLASDVNLIAEGAIFFWNIGRYRKALTSGKIGPSKHKFEIRFRRLPPLSAERLSEIKRLSRELSERLHGN